jgi:hypothetical protein
LQDPAPASTVRICLGHVGFSIGYTTIALSSESGDRQVVICANTLVMSDETWLPLGRLVWWCFCG